MYCLLWMFFTCLVGLNLGDDLQFGVQRETTKQTVTEGQKLFLNCLVMNLQENKHVVVWKRNKIFLTTDTTVVNALNEAEKQRISVIVNDLPEVGQYMLQIFPVKRSDAKYNYTCTVYDRETLKIDNSKPILQDKPISVTVRQIPSIEYPSCSSDKTSYHEGSMILLTCVTEEVNPSVSIRWHNYDNAVMKVSGNIKTLKLKVNATVSMNSIHFACSLTSPVIESRNCTITVDVQYSPKVTISGPRLIKLEKEEVYVCFPQANPSDNLIFTWDIKPPIYKDEYSIVNSDQVLRLRRKSYQPDKITLYCTVRNKIGTSTASILVEIENSQNYVIPDTSDYLNSQNNDHTDEITDENYTKSFDSTLVLSIIGSCLLITAILIALALCYFQLCRMQRHTLNSLGQHIAQPEVYFVPKDSVQHTSTEGGRKYWKRTVGIQVPSDLDKDSVYAEIEDGKKVLVNTQSISV